MKQQATIVFEGGKPMAEVMRPEACQACHACKFGQQQRVLMELPAGNYTQGDPIELNLPDGNVGKASMLAYGIPLVLMLLGIWLGSLIGNTDLYMVAGALIMTALGVLILKLLEPRLRRSGAFKPEACPIPHALTPHPEQTTDDQR